MVLSRMLVGGQSAFRVEGGRLVPGFGQRLSQHGNLTEILSVWDTRAIQRIKRWSIVLIVVVWPSWTALLATRSVHWVTSRSVC